MPKAGTIPYVHGVAVNQFDGPLRSMYSPLAADKDGTLRLLRTIHDLAVGQKMNDSQLEDRFAKYWSDLEVDLKALRIPLFKRSNLHQLEESERSAKRVFAYNDNLDAEVGAATATQNEKSKAYLHDAVLKNISKGCVYRYILTRRPWSTSFEQWVDPVLDQIDKFALHVKQKASAEHLQNIRLSLLCSEPPIPHISIDLHEFDDGRSAGFWCMDGPGIVKSENVFKVFDPTHLQRSWLGLEKISDLYGITGTLIELTASKRTRTKQRLKNKRREYSVDDRNWQDLYAHVNFEILSRIVAEV